MQPKYKAYLLAQGAAKTVHSGSSLWDHLLGVHDILQTNKRPEYLCTAGLFHSVYGTKSFKEVSVEKTRRKEIQALIGNKAESLVMVFCGLERPQLFEFALNQGISQLPTWVEQLEVTYDKKQFLTDLLALECANLAEQRTLHVFPLLAQHAQAIGILDQEGFLI